MIRVDPALAGELNQRSDGVSSCHCLSSSAGPYLFGSEFSLIAKIACVVRFMQALVAGDVAPFWLCGYFGEYAGADGSSAFADGESEVLFEGYGV